MLRRSIAVVSLLVFAFPGGLLAQSAGESRRANSGFVYLGTAPGFNFGGQSLPRALYMDFLHAGYVAPSGLDVSLAFSGMNFFPDEGEYSITMSRFSLGFRPFMKDPVPMIQPYGFVGMGLGAEGLYVCEEPPSCDPTKDVCTSTCSRANWRQNYFVGAGIDVNSHLFWIGQQQILFYAGVQARYELINTKYNMPVVTFPIGLRMQ